MEVVALPARRTSIVVVLLWGSRGERMMLSDRVSADGDLAPALAGCDWVHVSGYLLRDPAEAQRVVTALQAAAIDRVSVAGGSFAGWADAASARDAIAEIRACLVIVNREEAGLLAGVSTSTLSRWKKEPRIAGKVVPLKTNCVPVTRMLYDLSVS